MFKFLEIHLEGPICSCDKENLAWSLDIDEEFGEFDGVTILCQTCGEELYVYSQDFAAFFMFDKEYPKGRIVADDEEEEEEEERPKLQLIRGGKDEVDS